MGEVSCRQKEVVLLKYPFTDFKGSKVRPALIISNNQFNNTTEDRIMVPLTTALHQTPYSIFVTQAGMDSGILIRPSKIKADKIFTVSKSLILKNIGKVNSSKK